MKKLIVAHHGSPGLAKDFDHLKSHLPFDLKALERDNKNEPLGLGEHYVLGYSYGSRVAIASASKNLKEVKGIILVAPFLLKNTSPLMKTLMRVPLLSHALIGLSAKKAITEMVVKGSLPMTPPPGEYVKDAKSYGQIDILRQAVCEKDGNLEELLNDLKKLKNLPIIVIRGDSDTSADIKDIMNQAGLTYEDVVIEKAGHALLWSHPNILATHIEDFILPEAKTKRRFGYFDGLHIQNNVCAFLKDHVQKNSERKILTWVHPDKLKEWSGRLTDPLHHDSITIGELDHVVGRIAAEYKKLGIKSGDRVIIFIPMSFYLYAAMFALQKIGGIAVFLDSWARRDQMGVAAELVGATAMISVERAFDYLSEVPEIASIPLKIVAGPITKTYSARLEDLMKSDDYEVATPIEKEHTALITFTTGSSGTPKGADRSHRFLAAQHYALNRHIPYEKSDADLPVFPIFSLNNLAAGVKTVIPAIDVGTPGERDALILIAQMMATNTTCTTLSPSLLRAVSSYCVKNSLTLPFLKRIVTGGAPVSNDDVREMKVAAPNADILVLYGSTEVEPMAHIEAREMLAQETSTDSEWVDEGVNVGHFDSGLDVKYLKIDKGPIYINSDEDWKSKEVAKGSVGEIVVSGEHVCEKYYNNEEAFYRAKIRDHNNVVWHRTGDLGRVDEQGSLWLVGRVHNAINRGGNWVFPVRAEIVMKKLPFAKGVAYLGMPCPTLGEKVVCVFSLKENQSQDHDYYFAEMKRIMNKNNLPVDGIYLVDEIPMDPRHHSKVEYAILRSALEANQGVIAEDKA